MELRKGMKMPSEASKDHKEGTGRDANQHGHLSVTREPLWCGC